MRRLHLLALVLLPGLACSSAWRAVDQDGDGYSLVDGDCDDDNPLLNPGAEEVCDQQDNDCSGLVDDLPASSTDPRAVSVYLDQDNDGYGGKTASDYLGKVCEGATLPRYQTTDFTDCDDEDSTTHPNATEICDGVDNNCNGAIDEGCMA